MNLHRTTPQLPRLSAPSLLLWALLCCLWAQWLPSPPSDNPLPLQQSAITEENSEEISDDFNTRDSLEGDDDQPPLTATTNNATRPTPLPVTATVAGALPALRWQHPAPRAPPRLG